MWNLKTKICRHIKDALEVTTTVTRSCVMEVAQHIGNNTVRCIMLASSEGLYRDMEVIATGSGIKTPVGEQTLGTTVQRIGRNDRRWRAAGRMTNTGCIHREPPTFEEQSPVVGNA